MRTEAFGKHSLAMASFCFTSDTGIWIFGTVSPPYACSRFFCSASKIVAESSRANSRSESCLKAQKSLWQTLLLSGSFGFISAIGIHYYVGYTDLLHLLPAFLGAAIFTAAIYLASKQDAADIEKLEAGK
ncbi:MAG: hypothetical protein EA353_04960 [Puniceicoccaceae bacterium]|nr:MAG: hypothetical protein EA353_04960 [Puniceicoccaceae bacterium]